MREHAKNIILAIPMVTVWVNLIEIRIKTDIKHQQIQNLENKTRLTSNTHFLLK